MPRSRHRRRRIGEYYELKRQALQQNEEGEDPVKPERNLLRAVLVRALQDATGNTCAIYRPTERQEEAVTWFMDDETTVDDVMSFLWVCDNLFLKPQVLRDFVKSAIQHAKPLILNGHRYIRKEKPTTYRRGRMCA